MERELNLAHAKPLACSLEKQPDGSWLLSGGQEDLFFRMEGRLGAPDGGAGAALRYLVLEVENLNDTSDHLCVRFFEPGKTEHRMMLRVAMIASMPSRIVYDMKFLDAQTTYPPLRPCALKRFSVGDTTDLSRVDAMEIGLRRGWRKERRLKIVRAYWTDVCPEPLPAARKNVDEFGQWMDKDWQGKIRDEDTLVRTIRGQWEKYRNAPRPEGFDRWGGKLPARFEATGFFRVEKADGHWIFVDPDGCEFFSVGVFGVYPGEASWILGNTGYYSWLPKNEGKFAPAYSHAADSELFCRKFRGKFPDDTELFAYQTANLIRAFGDEWYEKWTEMTVGRLRQWGINTLSMFSDERFVKTSQMPYVIMLHNYPITKKKLFRDFPDVFSEEYETLCKAYAEQLKPYRDDPYLIGYFLNNEPQWGVLNELNLGEKLLESDDDTASRRALVEYLKEKYKEPAALNAAWGTQFADWRELDRPVAHAALQDEKAQEDLFAFHGILLARYAELPSRYTKAADPHHLDLGMRYAHMHNTSVLETSRYFDVFSFNSYRETPCDVLERLQSFGMDMPMLIGEFHYGALDRGLSHPSLFAVGTQKERGEAYMRFLSNAAAHPNTVAAHYFAYNDQPVDGRYDGENYQFGFVDVCHQPYPEFIDAVQETDRDIYEYVHGRKKPLGGRTNRL